jgi:hypothetical protein
MSDLQSQLNAVKSNESWLEKIKRYIPGYDGYVNKDNARELDTMVRNQLASKLEENKARIKNAVSSLSKNGRLFETSDIDKIDKKNENCIGQFKSAARGYSGAFDVIKIKEDKLNRIYEFDEALLSDVTNINSLFSALENNAAANLDVSGDVSKVSSALDELLRKFQERENILRTLN